MFTGLIEEIGTVRQISSSSDGTNLVISAQKILPGLKTGDSIAVSGPCLTVTVIARDSFTAWVMPETLEKTNLKQLKTGQTVNLERALALGDRLGGHMVNGHVDAVASLTEKKSQGAAAVFTLAAPANLMRYIVPKGSVALDGVSLTVIDVGQNSFSVGLIPHTYSHTTLGRLDIGAPVNLEVDLIGKYVEKMLEPRLESSGKKKETITMNLLEEKGYL